MKLWTGLASKTPKTATHHKFDALKDYQELLTAIMAVEREADGLAGQGTVGIESRIAPSALSPNHLSPGLEM